MACALMPSLLFPHSIYSLCWSADPPAIAHLIGLRFDMNDDFVRDVVVVVGSIWNLLLAELSADKAVARSLDSFALLWSTYIHSISDIFLVFFLHFHYSMMANSIWRHARNGATSWPHSSSLFAARQSQTDAVPIWQVWVTYSSIHICIFVCKYVCLTVCLPNEALQFSLTASQLMHLSLWAATNERQTLLTRPCNEAYKAINFRKYAN